MRRLHGLASIPVLSAALALTHGLILAARAPAAGPAPRPNVVMLIADDWSWPARRGLRRQGRQDARLRPRGARRGSCSPAPFCASPSCTPSRGAILTGQAIHRLENGGNLWSILPQEVRVLPRPARGCGLRRRPDRQGLGAGHARGERPHPQPGRADRSRTSTTFLDARPRGQAVLLLVRQPATRTGPTRRAPGVAARAWSPRPSTVPPFLPDTPEVRGDILDYYFEVQRFDRAVGDVLESSTTRGLADEHAARRHQRQRHALPALQGEPVRLGHAHAPGDPLAAADAEGGRPSTPSSAITDLAPTFLEAAGPEAARRR